MLRKLIFLAVASGLAKKAYTHYSSKSIVGVAGAVATSMPTAREKAAAQRLSTSEAAKAAS